MKGGTLKQCTLPTYATSGDHHRQLCWSTYAEAVNCQRMLVDVVLLLKDVVQVPHLGFKDLGILLKCLSMWCSFHTLMLRSMELVRTAFSVSVTRDLISTILCGIEELGFRLIPWSNNTTIQRYNDPITLRYSNTIIHGSNERMIQWYNETAVQRYNDQTDTIILCGVKVVNFRLIEIGNLEVSYQPLHQTSSVHVPHDDLLPYAWHGKLVLRRENDVVGVVELLADVSHSIRELQCNAPASICQLFTQGCLCIKKLCKAFCK